MIDRENERGREKEGVKGEREGERERKEIERVRRQMTKLVLVTRISNHSILILPFFFSNVKVTFLEYKKA